VADTLHAGTPGGGRGGEARLRRSFVVGEVALALMLLVGSMLMLRGLYTLLTAESGIDPEGVATLELTLSRAEFATPIVRQAFLESVLERLRSDPRVDVAAAINELPLRGIASVQLPMYPEGRRPTNSVESPYAQYLQVTPDYFRAMGIDLVAGRAPRLITPLGAPVGTPQEVAISASFARLYWPDRQPLGELIDWPGGKFQIVGIVEDVRPTTLEDDFVPQAYAPLRTTPDLALVARGRGDPADLARLLEEAVHQVAPTQAVYNVRSMSDVMTGAIQARRMNTFLIAAFGALALALASVGVYGVISFSVARRTREIGIRIALGARSARVLRAVLREGIALALVGTALGLGGAWLLSRVVESLLYGVTTRDPLTFVLAPVVLLTSALAAAAVPAWRATRVSPVDAIRTE
jgi:predicted permease